MTYEDIYQELNIIYQELINYTKREVNDNISIRYNKFISLYKRYLQLVVYLDSILPSYNTPVNGNCYFYALNININKIFMLSYHKLMRSNLLTNLGLNKPRCYLYSASNILDYLYSDLEYLNIAYYNSDINMINKHNGYKIAIFREVNYQMDYHFIREDINGLWSHKLGYTNKYERNIDLWALINNYNKDLLQYEYLKTIEIVKPRIRIK